MGTDVTEVEEALLDPRSFKVHRSMCTELLRLIDIISRILPEIEKARPNCSSGIQSLCLLQGTIEKAKLLLQYCCESSKLYLAITGDTIISRCQRSRNLLEQSLVQLQSMVLVTLAAKIGKIINELRNAVFIMDFSEDEAGKNLLQLLKQGSTRSHSIENFEMKAIRLAALKLHIMSPKALLIEKRSIRKLLDRTGDNERPKRRILKYLLYLLKKYGNTIMEGQTEDSSVQQDRSFTDKNSYNSSVHVRPVEVELPNGYRQCRSQSDVFGNALPADEFKCPLSSVLMYDPVVIASGQTFERMWIQKWLDEGNNACPKTNLKLAHQSLTPNTAMKDLISKWCAENGVTIPNPMIPSDSSTWETSSTSIASLGNINDFHLQIDVSNISLESLDTSYSYSTYSAHPKVTESLNLILVKTDNDSRRCHSNANMNETDLEIFSCIAELQWESQCKVVEDFNNCLKSNNQNFHHMPSDINFAQVTRFLTDACDQHDVEAQKAGCQLLLTFLSRSRNGSPYLQEDAFSLFASLLDSEVTEEALAVIGLLSDHQECRSKIKESDALTFILSNLNSKSRDFQETAIKILYNLSSSKDISSQMVFSECIPKLAPFITDPPFTRNCVTLLKNLCDTEEGRAAVAESSQCIASLAELLDIGNQEDQELAVTILLSFCSQREQYCQLVMDEGVIPALVNISINGNEIGKASSQELLRQFRDLNHGKETESGETEISVFTDSDNYSQEKKSTSKVGFFGKKMTIFGSHAPKKKK